jgi:hypothetical protein
MGGRQLGIAQLATFALPLDPGACHVHRLLAFALAFTPSACPVNSGPMAEEGASTDRRVLTFRLPQTQAEGLQVSQHQMPRMC